MKIETVPFTSLSEDMMRAACQDGIKMADLFIEEYNKNHGKD